MNLEFGAALFKIAQAIAKCFFYDRLELESDLD